MAEAALYSRDYQGEFFKSRRRHDGEDSRVVTNALTAWIGEFKLHGPCFVRTERAIGAIDANVGAAENAACAGRIRGRWESPTDSLRELFREQTSRSSH